MSDRIGDYRIVENLGKGGFGDVWKAVHVDSGATVALKTCERGRVENFEREIDLLDRLMAAPGPGKSFIAPLLESHLEEDPAHVVLEYFPGGNLRKRIDRTRGGGLGYPEACRIAANVCRALSHAHAQGIVHRDLTPENILFGANGSACVADFGLGRISAEEFDWHLAVRGIESRLIVGKRRYLSPEQRSGGCGVDHRADLYALGVVFYQMLVGSCEQTPGHDIRKDLCRFDVPAPLVNVLVACLRHDPEARWQSAGELRLALEQFFVEGGKPGEIVLPSDRPRRAISAAAVLRR